VNAADHLREAIDVGCTHDHHDHIGDHRAEVVNEATEAVERDLIPLPIGEAEHHVNDVCRRIAAERRRMGEEGGPT
jgi:hypothetical protein